MKFKKIDMEMKCWFCKHFYEKCDKCIDKSKWELWEGNESYGNSRNNSSIRGFEENARSTNDTASKCK